MTSCVGVLQDITQRYFASGREMVADDLDKNRSNFKFGAKNGCSKKWMAQFCEN